MYQSEPDPYCYPGTNILINKPNIRDQSALDAYEAEMTAERAMEPLSSGPLTSGYYLAIHHHLFQDVYEWAGKVRRIRLSKGGNSFCYPEYIDPEIAKLFENLTADNELSGLSRARFAEKSGVLIAELNAIHPFREGNGRTQLSFLVELSERAGHPLNLDRLDPRAILSATIASLAAIHGSLQKPSIR